MGKNVGLYKVKNIPAKFQEKGGGISANTMKYNLTYEHAGVDTTENQLNPYKTKGGRNVFEEALGDGRVRFVLRPKGYKSPERKR